MREKSTPDLPGMPLLRWAGSKRQLVPVLREFWRPTYRRYVEPFAGSACLFFAIRPSKALLGDVNSDLISTYVEIKYRHAKLLARLKRFHNNRKAFLRIRAQNFSAMSPAARAARFIYLNRFCFNGLYRTNSKGHFNVPYGGVGSGRLPSGTALERCSRALKSARLIRGDFEKVLTRVEPGDFIYMDPPFAVQKRRVFNEYDPSCFSIEDVKRLRVWMENLAARKIKFVVSYAESEEAELLLKGFDHIMVTVKRNISGFTDSRRRSTEALIFNG
jgi:DNA adenine methylase